MPLPQNTTFYFKTPKSKGVKEVIHQMSLYSLITNLNHKLKIKNNLQNV